jgi:ribosomal protein S7
MNLVVQLPIKIMGGDSVITVWCNAIESIRPDMNGQDQTTLRMQTGIEYAVPLPYTTVLDQYMGIKWQPNEIQANAPGQPGPHS